MYMFSRSFLPNYYTTHTIPSDLGNELKFEDTMVKEIWMLPLGQQVHLDLVTS